MKMTTEMLAIWKAAIAPLDTTATRAAYRRGEFDRAGICAAYDAGMTDVHVDTALRAIVAPLGKADV